VLISFVRVSFEMADGFVTEGCNVKAGKIKFWCKEMALQQQQHL